MRFVVDAQLPPALARYLADQGHTAEHVLDLGLNEAEDSAIWDYALRYDAAVITKDEDFSIRIAMQAKGPCHRVAARWQYQQPRLAKLVCAAFAGHRTGLAGGGKIDLSGLRRARTGDKLVGTMEPCPPYPTWPRRRGLNLIRIDCA